MECLGLDRRHYSIFRGGIIKDRMLKFLKATLDSIAVFPIEYKNRISLAPFSHMLSQLCEFHATRDM